MAIFDRPRGFDELDPRFEPPEPVDETPPAPSEEPVVEEASPADFAVAAGGRVGPRPPRPFAQELAAASGLGGSFQQAGSRGAVPFRSAKFFQDRFTAPAKPISFSAGTPLAAVGGERDDAQRAFRLARLGRPRVR